MADTAFRQVVAPGASTAQVLCTHGKMNLRWIVWQMSVEVSTANSQAQITSVRRNGRFITSSFTVPSAAQGPPAISLEGSDVLEVNFAGMNAGEEAIVTLFYEEVMTGERGSAFGLV